MARLWWEQMSNKWWRLRDSRGMRLTHLVKYRGYDRDGTWEITYFNMTKNHGLLQSEVPEEQLRRNLEMEYLLTREEQ